MKEIETPNADNIQTFLRYGTYDLPPLVLSEQPDDTLVQATDCSSLPPLFDAVPSRRPYAIFNLREVHPIPSSSKDTVDSNADETIPAVQQETETLTASAPKATTIIVVSDLPLDPSKEGSKKNDRRLLRVKQFGRLMNVIHQWQRNVDGSLKPEQVNPTRWMISKLSTIAFSWYENELSKDPLAQQIVQDMIESSWPEADAAVQAAETLLRKSSMNFIAVWTDAKRILNPPKDDREREIFKRDGKKEDTKQETEAAAQAEKQFEEKCQEIIQESERLVEIRKTGNLYVHDPELDEPDPEAAAYVRDLWQRAF